ncbi:MAG TPA: dipeptidase [Bryobacteraceae bacterium]|nr:dipeptidase [Bryobacteraceae bacterium]
MRFALFLCTACLWAEGRKVSDAEVQAVHRSALLIDSHNDVPMKTVTGFDIGSSGKGGDTDLPRMKAGGLAAQFFAVYVSGKYVRDRQSAHHALEVIDTVRHDIIERYPRDFELALTADDIVAIRKRGKIAALMGIEGGHAIEDSLRLLRQYYNLGVRYMTLTHSNTNGWADSSGDITKEGVKHHNGLTAFGKDVIREMNRIGMMVDVSHAADKTFWDALEVSSAPLIASHSSCRAISNQPRNMTDEMIQALAKKGGVIQINFACDFLSQKSADSGKAEKLALKKQFGEDMDALRAAEKTAAAIVPATLNDVVAQIDHVVKIAGAGHVGLGSDFDGVDCAPTGLDDVSRFPNLTRALLEKGYSAEDVRKIYGGNLLRVMRAVEKTAHAK